MTASEKERLWATGARLHLRVEGETFVMGNAAREKAREVGELVSALQSAGLDPQGIEVQGVRLGSATGLLGKNQKVAFHLVAALRPEQLPAALGAVAAQRNARVQQLEWQFDDFEASVVLAAQAMQKARRKADAIAQAAGQRVTGVHGASDSWSMPSAHLELDLPGAPTMQRVRAVQSSPLDVGVEYSATQELEVTLTVDFTLD